MKRYFCILVFLFPVIVFAQPASSFDIGGGLGVSSYFGDINQHRIFYKPSMSFSGFLRYNIDKRYSIRGDISGVRLKGDDLDFDNSYQQKRAEHFSVGLFEVAVLGEVNFFPFVNPQEWESEQGTVYAVLGASSGMLYAKKRKKISIPSIVMGVGYKRVLGNRWGLELEWAFRKNLKDNLDGIVDPIKSGQNSRLFNNDWYNILAVKISYNLWQQSGKCRTFNKNSDI